MLLVLPEDASVDVQLGEAAVQEAEAALGVDDARLALDRAQTAREVLAGPFLPGHESPWVQEQRREVEELRLRALEGVANAGLLLGGARLAAAEAAARQLVAAEPLRERGYRLLMDVLAARHDVAAALQTYEQLRIRLRDELGVMPAAALRARHERLLAGPVQLPDGDRREAEAATPPEARRPGREPERVGAALERAAESRPGVGGTASARELAKRWRIVATKVMPPLLRPGIVDRPSLIDGFLAEIHAPVALLSAPAGYGKTTLLALWRERDERPFTWVTLDAGDNDPVALVAAVLAALDPVLHPDDALAEALLVPEPPLEDVVLPSLVNACAEAGRPFVLVLDDLHLVTDARSHAAIGYLAERLPSGCQLALASRADPPLPLGRLRAQGRLVELRAAELSLRSREARALLAAAGVRLSDDRVAQLVERTEGWPAAVYLAALWLRDGSRPEAFVDRFTRTAVTSRISSPTRCSPASGTP